MLLKIPLDAVKLLPAAAAALVLAMSAGAQEAEDPAATEAPQAEEPAAAEPSGEASGEAGPPENAGEEAAAAGAEAVQAAIEQAAGEAAENAEEDTADGPVVVDVEEGTVIDDQTFEGEDDDFIPSEEIPIDEAIPFPTDI